VSKSILKSSAFIVEYTATKFQDGQKIIKHWFSTLLLTTAKIFVRRLLHDMDFIIEDILILIICSNLSLRKKNTTK
jgi:hypothetical protein